MTVAFTNLEFHMQLMLQGFLPGSPGHQHARVAHIVASQLTFSRLRATLISLYKERNGEDEHFPRLKELMVRAGKIEEERNLITHSVWGVRDDGTIARMKSTAREKRGFHLEFKNIQRGESKRFRREYLPSG